MRILVTGSEGLIGKELCWQLRQGGHTVTGFDVRSRGDETVLSFERLDRLFSRFRPEVVFHLAAIVGPQSVVKNPEQTVMVNTLGTRYVLGSCSRYKVRQIIFTSTSEVYGDRSGHMPRGMTEDMAPILGDPADPRTCYAASKVAAECLVHDYNGIVARIFNTTGPGQSPQYVIPNMIRRALLGEPIEIYGSGMQTRSFIHVIDTVRGLIALMDYGYPGTWNIGSDQEISILELAERVREFVAPVPIEFLVDVPWGKMEFNRRANIEKMKTLGWKPEISLNQLLESVRTHQQTELDALREDQPGT